MLRDHDIELKASTVEVKDKKNPYPGPLKTPLSPRESGTSPTPGNE